MADIIVLGRNYSTTIGIVRSLGSAGHHVDVIYVSIRQDTEVVEACKYVGRLIEIKKRNEQAVLDAILSLKKETKQVLFSTDDFTAELIDRNRERLKDDFLFSYINNGDPGKQIEHYMDKTVQKGLADGVGLPTAKSWILDLTQDETVLPEDLVYPCFAKPLVSADGGKSDIGKCEDREALLAKIAGLKKRGRTALLVQEFLDIKDEYVIGGVCSDQQVIIPGVSKKSRVARHNKGVTVCGTLCRPDILPSETLEKVEALLKAFRYVGIYDLELIEANGKLYFGELNLRSGGPGYIYTLSGINLPDLAVKAILGEEIGGGADVTFGKTFVSDKVAWEDYLYGDITRRELNECYASAEYSLTNDPDDPKPGKIFRRNMMKKDLRRRIRKLLGRK